MGQEPSSLAVGDFNSDGQEDVAVTNQVDGTVMILLNDGGGLTVQDTLTSGPSPAAIVAQDFDGNGKLDLAVLNSGDGTIGIFLAQSTGGFGAQQTFSAGSAPVALVSGDFNRDGVPDLASLDPGTDSVSVFPGSGAGAFGAALTSMVGLSDGGSTGSPVYPAYNPPPAMVVGDLRGTGVLDLAIVDGVQLIVLLGDGTGRFSSVAYYATGTQPVDVAIGDFDGDGKLDLVVATYGSDGVQRPGDNTVGVFLGKGDGTFADQVTYPSNYIPAWVRLVDLNGDGKAEIILTRFGEDSINVLWHLPGGGVSRPIELFVPTRWPGRTVPIHLQGSGGPDLVSAKQSNSDGQGISSAVTTTFNGCP